MPRASTKLEPGLLPQLLDDVPAAVAGLRTARVQVPSTPQGGASFASQSYPFYYDPKLVVREWAHIQGVARLCSAGNENCFVFSKHNKRDRDDAGIFIARWPRTAARGGLIQLDAPGRDAGVGQRIKRSFGRATHAGGVQLCGHVLAIAQTEEKGKTRVAPWIDFVDLRDPETPVYLDARITLDAASVSESPSAVTSVALTRSEAGNYLCFAYRYQSGSPGNPRGWLFVSDTASLGHPSRWRLLARFGKRIGPADTSTQPFPSVWKENYENIGFLGQRDGSLFLCGFRGWQTDNYLDLYRVAENPLGLSLVSTTAVRTRDGGASFRAGGCLYVTRSGELALYACQKANGRARLSVEEFSARPAPR